MQPYKLLSLRGRDRSRARRNLTIFALLVVAAFVVPVFASAAWWNPASWFSKEAQSEKQKQSQSANLESQTAENLKTEIATLKASLDNLYIAHNNLANDYNALLKYVNATVLSDKNTGVTINNSNLDGRVVELEKKLRNICRQVFSSLGALGGDNCPSTGLIGKEALESRVKKLEGRY